MAVAAAEDMETEKVQVSTPEEGTGDGASAGVYPLRRGQETQLFTDSQIWDLDLIMQDDVIRRANGMH